MAIIELGGLRIPQAALTWSFVRASGPGGQNVNKVCTAVECRLDLNAAGLRGAVRQRIERMAGRRLTAKGEVVIFADARRTQPRNRAAAIARLDALFAAARPAPRRRIPTALPAAAKARRREAKKRRGAVKEMRRRPPP